MLCSPDNTGNSVLFEIDSVVLHNANDKVQKVSHLLGSRQTLHQLQQEITCDNTPPGETRMYHL